MDDQHSPTYVPPLALPGGRPTPEARSEQPEEIEPPSSPRRPIFVAPTRDEVLGEAGREGWAWRVEPIESAPEQPAAAGDDATVEAPAALEASSTEPGLAPAAAEKVPDAEAPAIAVPLRPQDEAPTVIPPSPQVERIPERTAPQARVTRPFDVLLVRGSRLRLAAWFLVILLVIVAAVWLVGRGVKQPSSGRFQSGGPMPVGTAQVKQGDMPVTLTALGTVTALAQVTVKTQINGQLTEVAFTEGQTVRKGDFLAQIDPRPYQVALDQAQAQLAKDQAVLQNAQVDLARYRMLVAQNSIARQTLDTQIALVAQDQAVVQADQAQIAAQKLNLTYCHIVAPVSGRVGLRQVDPGNYVQTSDANGIVVITQLQPISVIFTLPEDNLPNVLRRVNAGATLQVTALDRTGTTPLGTGKLDTIDNLIDTTTGTVKLRAVFDNAEGILFPNQFVNVQLLVDTMHEVKLVPNSAIERGAPGTFVYIVTPDNTVAVQKVKLGPTDGMNQAILSGLEVGQNVVTDGADRLKDGAKVTLAPAGNPGRASGTAPAAAGAVPEPTAPAAAGAPGTAGQPGARRHRAPTSPQQRSNE